MPREAFAKVREIEPRGDWVVTSRLQDTKALTPTVKGTGHQADTQRLGRSIPLAGESENKISGMVNPRRTWRARPCASDAWFVEALPDGPLCQATDRAGAAEGSPAAQPKIAQHIPADLPVVVQPLRPVVNMRLSRLRRFAHWNQMNIAYRPAQGAH